LFRWQFTSAYGWTTQAGKLPGFGTPVDLPPWLRSKAILTAGELDAIRNDLERVCTIRTEGKIILNMIRGDYK